MNDLIELRVWVGCMACYNEGNLVGKWMTVEEVAAGLDRAAIHGGEENLQVLQAYSLSVHDEYWCYDNELPAPFDGEIDPMTVTTLAVALPEIKEALDFDEELIEGYFLWADDIYGADLVRSQPTVGIAEFTDNGPAVTGSADEYVQDLFSESLDMGGVPEVFRTYFDWDSYTRDALLDYSVYRLSSGSVLMVHC